MSSTINGQQVMMRAEERMDSGDGRPSRPQAGFICFLGDVEIESGGGEVSLVVLGLCGDNFADAVISGSISSTSYSVRGFVSEIRLL